MSSRAKKILIISSILLVFCLLFLGVYNFAFKEKTLKSPVKKEPVKESPTVEENKKETKKNISSSQNQKIYPITDEEVLSPIVTPDGDHVRYYVKATGHVYEVSRKGAGKNIVSDKNLPGLIDVLWSPSKDKVIATFNKEGVFEKHFFDYTTKTDKLLDPAITNISWTNLGDKILYKYAASHSDKRFLSLADPDGKNWKNLCNLPWPNVKIAPVPKSSHVAFWKAPDSFEESVLKIISLSGGEAQTIFEKRFGADYLWSPDGNKILISSSDTKGGAKMTLAVINSNGGEYQNLNIPTLTNKCVWSKNSQIIYYALPGSIPEGSVMPNDYLNGTIKTRDTFWKVNIKTGQQDRLVELNDMTDPFDAVDLFLSDTEGILYFTNRIDGRLYGIDI